MFEVRIEYRNMNFFAALIELEESAAIDDLIEIGGQPCPLPDGTIDPAAMMFVFDHQSLDDAETFARANMKEADGHTVPVALTFPSIRDAQSFFGRWPHMEEKLTKTDRARLSMRLA